MELTRLQIETLPHYRKKTAREYSATCPFCGGGGGRDRFLFWPDKGNYFCRKCGAKGFVADGSTDWTPEERERYHQEAAERAAKEREAKRAAVEELAARAHLADEYHRQLTDRSFWYGKGVNDWAIDHYRLGYCPACPTYHASPSYTIPVTFKSKLLNIRHRLTNPPTPGDKYRPERAGLPALMFNADVLLEPQTYVVLVEGEIKTVVLSQYGFPTVGIPGANIFPDRWVKWFSKQRLVYVALDPGAEGHARDIVSMLGKAARLVTLFCKPDDFLTLHGGTAGDLCAFLSQGRKAR
jgi:DNA primase